MAEAWISGWKESLKPLWLALGAHWSLQKSWKPTEYFLGLSGRNRRRQVQFGFVGSQTAQKEHSAHGCAAKERNWCKPVAVTDHTSDFNRLSECRATLENK